MPEPSQTSVQNRLLRQLSESDFAVLAPHLQTMQGPRAMVLAEPDQPVHYVYFPETFLGSIVTLSPEGFEVESGMFGRDGFAPTNLVLGVETSPARTIIQVPGDGYRIPVARFHESFDASLGLRSLLLRYAHVLSVQTSHTALSNAVHQIDERLARWLLMCHDRIDGDELSLTHEFLSVMLAVRRPSVTTALHLLEGSRLITTERGYITIRDRAKLEEFAADAYGRPEAEYDRLITGRR